MVLKNSVVVTVLITPNGYLTSLRKAGPFLHCNAFPLSNEAVLTFKTLKNDLCNASLA